ncbi:MAG: ABC transporter ATP-binding protein [bacterium]
MINYSEKTREILRVEGLTVEFHKKPTLPIRILSDICFSLNKGEILGLVGESGVGKSLLGRTLLRLENPAKITSGRIFFDGHDLCQKKQKEMQRFRGGKISLLFQSPQSNFDPLFTIRDQFEEFLLSHNIHLVKKETYQQYQNHYISKKEYRETIYRLLEEVGISSPEIRSLQYPHQWSGGMLHRASLAMAIHLQPEVLILDEITSALDPTITCQLLELLIQLNKKHHIAIILITHDLAVCLKICNRIAVIYKGTIVETGKANDIFLKQGHSYTQLLVSTLY